MQVVLATIDLTLPEFEHLANHLTTDECHKLVAALHFDSFKLNQAVENAENAGRWFNPLLSCNESVISVVKIYVGLLNNANV